MSLKTHLKDLNPPRVPVQAMIEKDLKERAEIQLRKDRLSWVKLFTAAIKTYLEEASNDKDSQEFSIKKDLNERKEK